VRTIVAFRLEVAVQAHDQHGRINTLGNLHSFVDKLFRRLMERDAKSKAATVAWPRKASPRKASFRLAAEVISDKHLVRFAGFKSSHTCPLLAATTREYGIRIRINTRD
jgi:hypothetical protein